MSARFDFIAPLFVPGNRPERFEKAAASGADAVIIDLEDAVPASGKIVARAGLRVDFTDLPVLVRVNGIGTSWYTEDLAAVARLPFAGIVIPKATLVSELERLGSSAEQSQHAVIALIETAQGLADARLMAALPRVERLAFGSIDFCADVGCAPEREALLLARSELVLASRLAGKPGPLDGVTTTFDDVTQVIEDSSHARTLGYSGKLCIHPKQVGPVRAAFCPSPAEVAWAERVLASGEGVTAANGAMVDEPVRIRARAILLRAAQRES